MPWLWLLFARPHSCHVFQTADGAPVDKKVRRSESFFKTHSKQRTLMFDYAPPTVRKVVKLVTGVRFVMVRVLTLSLCQQTWDEYGLPFDTEKIKLLEEASAIVMPVTEAVVEERAAQEAMATEVNEVRCCSPKASRCLMLTAVVNRCCMTKHPPPRW